MDEPRTGARCAEGPNGIARRRRSFTKGLAAGLVPLMVIAAACGDDSDETSISTGSEGSRPSEPPEAPANLAAAADEVLAATTDVRSAHVDVGMAFETGFVDSSMYLETAFDADSDVIHMTGTATTGSERINIDLRGDGRTGWLQFDHPEITNLLPPGATWIEAPYQDLLDAEILTEVDGDFMGWLVLMRGVDEVEDRGVDQVHGVPVRMLEGQLDYEAARAAASPQELAELDESLTLTGTEDADATLTVGIDGDSRIRYFEVGLEVNDGPNGDTVEMTLELSVRGFDLDISTPEAPPADETVPLADVPEILGRL